MDTDNIDFKKILHSAPNCYLILKPDSPRFTILEVSDAYATATKTERSVIIGKGIFEVFPDNPNDPKADGVKKISTSLENVLANKKADIMPVLKYDIPNPDGGSFIERFWSPQNSPVFDDSNRIIYIIHYVFDVTNQVNTEHSLLSKMEELEKMNKLMIGRELKMVELKTELEELKNKTKE